MAVFIVPSCVSDVLTHYVDIELVTPRETGGTGPNDFRRQLVIVISARESEHDRKVTTPDERTSTETLVDCYNGLIKLKDEKTRKAVSLDIGAIPMMVLPESAIRTPVFDDEMVAGSMVKPESFFRHACQSSSPSWR